MTQNSSKHNKLKEWREVRILKMSTIVKTQFHKFYLVPFMVTLDIFRAMPFRFYC